MPTIEPFQATAELSVKTEYVPVLVESEVSEVVVDDDPQEYKAADAIKMVNRVVTFIFLGVSWLYVQTFSWQN